MCHDSEPGTRCVHEYVNGFAEWTTKLCHCRVLDQFCREDGLEESRESARMAALGEASLSEVAEGVAGHKPLRSRGCPVSCKDKDMPTCPSMPPGHSLNPQIPSVIFANWREMLNQHKLPWAKRQVYAEARDSSVNWRCGGGCRSSRNGRPSTRWCSCSGRRWGRNSGI